MRKRKQKFGTCVYCGKNGELTRDHIPPENLFPKPRPNDLMTVPSCLDCNGPASKDDEFFRQCLLLREDTLLLPEPSKLLLNLMRSLERPNYPGLLKDLRSRVYRGAKYSPKGFYMGEVIKQDIDTGRLDRVPKRIVKGLVYRKLGKRLPDEYFVSAFSVSGETNIPQSLQIITDKLEEQPKTLVGDGSVFTYRHRTHSNNPYISQWLLTFYQKTDFLGFTIPNRPKPNPTLYPTPYVDF